MRVELIENLKSVPNLPTKYNQRNKRNKRRHVNKTLNKSINWQFASNTYERKEINIICMYKKDLLGFTIYVDVDVDGWMDGSMMMVLFYTYMYMRYEFSSFSLKKKTTFSCSSSSSPSYLCRYKRVTSKVN